nr:hypothetical protein [Tanacetum cinerariifolium]
MPGDVVCLDIAHVPEGRQRYHFLVVGSYNNTICILSLDPHDCMQVLSIQSVTAAPEPWLGYVHQGHFLLTPLSYETLEYAASFSSNQCAEGVVVVVGDALRVFTIERLEETFNKQLYLCGTCQGSFCFILKRNFWIENDQGAIPAELHESAKKEC